MKDESLQVGPYGHLFSVAEPPTAAVGVDVGDIELGRSLYLLRRTNLHLRAVVRAKSELIPTDGEGTDGGSLSRSGQETDQTTDLQGANGLPKPIN